MFRRSGPNRERNPLNNNTNRNNNNRRRGRGNNNRQQGGGGGQQLNRIDSRARGNAPQLLEKYRKLAHDAHLNGDRVQAEYYLQFADHYFRVLADQRVRQEEQRGRRDERWEGGSEENEDSGDYAPVSDFPSFDQPSYQRPPRPVLDEQPREERQDRPREDRQREDRPRDERPRRNERRDERDYAETVEAPQGDDGGEDIPRSEFEPPENPFVRDNGNTRGLRPRREGRGALREPQGNRDSAARSDEPAPAFDASILPPAIAVASDEATTDVEAPVKKPRGRPRKIVEAAPVEQD
jgi:hypothetical protein